MPDRGDPQNIVFLEMLRRERKEREASHQLLMATLIMLIAQPTVNWDETKRHLDDMERRYTDELWQRSYDFVYRIVELERRRARLQVRLNDFTTLDDVAF